MMATFVGRILAAQRANASADVDQAGAILYQLGDARRSRSRGYIAYLFDGKSWTCRPTQIADQPRSGFTVAAYEDEDEIETLCRTYEQTDEEGRRLIRLVAEKARRKVSPRAARPCGVASGARGWPSSSAATSTPPGPASRA